jgi:hypothetical protein
MSKHTPGPWSIAPSGQTVWADFPHDDPNSGLRVGIAREIARTTANDPTDRANASLIAAAPALVDVLRECMDYLSCIPESAAGGDDAAGQICKRARAALTAAGIE